MDQIALMQYKLKEYFKELNFKEDDHTYEVRGISLTSVSNVIKRYTEKVDFDAIAGAIARREGVTKEVILARWAAKRDNACIQGKVVHAFGEDYHELKVPSNGFEEAIVKFWDNLPPHYIPFLFEIKMFSETLGIAGTADIIIYNALTGKFIIADYKTNEDLFKNFKGKTLTGPFGDLLDSPFNKYQIQLSSYQLLFEQSGYDVESRFIIWLRANGTYQVYKTEDLSTRLLKEFTKRN